MFFHFFSPAIVARFKGGRWRIYGPPNSSRYFFFFFFLFFRFFFWFFRVKPVSPLVRSWNHSTNPAGRRTYLTFIFGTREHLCPSELHHGDTTGGWIYGAAGNGSFLVPVKTESFREPLARVVVPFFPFLN